MVHHGSNPNNNKCKNNRVIVNPLSTILGGKGLFLLKILTFKGLHSSYFSMGPLRILPLNVKNEKGSVN